MDMIYDFCFLYHPHPYEVDPNSQIGLGLLSLATYAKSLGASVKVINAQGVDVPYALAQIPKCKNLMLYGCLTDAPVLNEICKGVHQCHHLIRPNIYIGGPIAKSPYSLYLPSINAWVDGPGEDFVYFIYCGKEFNGNVTIIRLLKNINEYPFPDRSLLEGNTGGNIFKKSKCEVSTTLMTSRGCQFNCAFCSSGNNSFFQTYDVSRIEKELEHCLSLEIKNFRISDDNFMGNEKKLITLCQLFKEAKITWRASTRTLPNDSWIYRMMVESGCKELSFGIESGDQTVLDKLGKKTKIHHNTQAVQNANQAGVEVTRALLMMGSPGETKKTLQRNIEWVNEAQPTIVSLKMFVPYPGTAIHDNSNKYNCKLFPIEDANFFAYRPDGSTIKAHIETTDMTREELTDQFHFMRHYLEKKGVENRG